MTRRAPTHFLWADLMRIISIFFVVLLHTSAVLLYQWQHIPSDFWWAANIYDSFARVSVPLFIMLSGALLLPKQEKYFVFFSKRLRRILVPWIFWTAVYVVWATTFHGVSLHSFAEFKRLVIETFLGGFWFLVMLVGVYILTPIWRIFVQYAHAKDYVYVLSLWFLITSALPFIGALLHKELIFSLPLGLQYSGYFVLGFLFTKIDPVRLRPKKLLFLTLYSSSLIAVGTFWLTSMNAQFIDIFYGYLNPLQVICAIALFLLIYSFQEKQLFSFFKLHKLKTQQKARKVILQLSEATFGIFLVHIIILEVIIRGIGRFNFSQTSLHPLLAIPVLTVIVYFLSFMVIKELRHFSLGKLIT